MPTRIPSSPVAPPSPGTPPAPTTPPSVVKEAKKALALAGFAPRDFDKAVRDFQGAWGLPVTGTVDAATLSRLRGTARRIHAHRADDYVSVGQKSGGILTVEKRLRLLGYDTGTVDGIYSRQTAEAVKAFRADQLKLRNGIGALNTGSLKALRQEANGLQHAPERRRVAPTKAQARLDAATAKATAAGLREGDRGAAVKNLQLHLRAAGFSPKHVGGVFDERTTGAMKAFQRRSGLPATGVADGRTWRALKKSFILTDSKASPAQALGERSGAVKASEKLLAQLGFNPGRVDGLFDGKTQRAVKAFERSQRLTQDGRISAAQLGLMKRLSQGVTLRQLTRIMPNLPLSKARAYLPHLNRAMAEADITTEKRKAMFLAQLAHESVELRYFEEIASGAAYEGRADLGNTQPGDGVRFKGRGPIQLTGRSNYRAAGRALGLPLEQHPRRVANPGVGFRTSAWFWKSRGLNAWADKGDFREVTRRINGGYNGYEDRLRYYRRALAVL